MNYVYNIGVLKNHFIKSFMNNHFPQKGTLFLKLFNGTKNFSINYLSRMKIKTSISILYPDHYNRHFMLYVSTGIVQKIVNRSAQVTKFFLLSLQSLTRQKAIILHKFHLLLIVAYLMRPREELKWSRGHKNACGARARGGPHERSGARLNFRVDKRNGFAIIKSYIDKRQLLLYYAMRDCKV